MINKTDNCGTTIYQYDAENRLIGINGFSPNCQPLTATYYYDPFGRRLWKDVNGNRTYFLYADEGLIGEYDASGNEIKTYSYEANSTWTTNPLFQKIGANYYWYQNDHLGTPQELTDINGSVVWSATYTAFGEATVDPSSTVTNNLRFPGQYYDAETGKHYNWNRYYDPKTGRFISEDPIGLNGGDMNLYTMVGNNPVNWIDPWGLEPWSIADMDNIEEIMAKWEAANTPYAKKGSKYAGRNAEQGKGADCSGSMYGTIKDADFDIKYFTTAQLKQAGNNKDVDKYYKVRVGDPQRGDLILFSGHVVYYLRLNSKGQHEVYGAHYTGGPNFNKHTYPSKKFKPIKILYYDNQ